MAQARSLPLIDYYAEILSRRSGTTWQNTLIDTEGVHPTFVAAALNGNHRFTADEAKKVGALLELDGETTAALSKFPVRTDFPNAADPFKYRLLEIIGVYGDSLRDQANEMFGDGIMSAIDFTLDMEKVTGSQGEARCKITLNGKWLEYKTF